MESTLVAAGLALTVAVWIMWSLKGARSQAIPYNFLLLTCCLSMVHDPERGWPRWTAGVIAGAAALLVVGTTVLLSWSGFVMSPGMPLVFLMLGSVLFIQHSFAVLGVAVVGCIVLGVVKPKR